VSGTTSSFTYNGTGQRVSKTVGENTTDYVWSNSGSLPVVLYDGDYYVYGLGLIAKTDSQDGQLYYLTDGLASTTGLTDGEGNVVGTYTYDVFGAIRSETGGQANDFKFTGQQLDAVGISPAPAAGSPKQRASSLASATSLLATRVPLQRGESGSGPCPVHPADRLNGRLHAQRSSPAAGPDEARFHPVFTPVFESKGSAIRPVLRGDLLPSKQVVAGSIPVSRSMPR
jgi:hypothetical protein